jgi:anti-sigma factor RsiW
MGPDQQRLTPTERANLVAYLDGELADPDARAIATKLAHSATARREVEALEKTWDLLEYLPRPKASEDFTARTLSQVLHDDVQSNPLGSTALRIARRAGSVLLGITLGLLAFAIGYALVQWVWPNPSARLTRELPIAEHLDAYRDVGSFEFLRELVESPEFNADRD